MTPKSPADQVRDAAGVLVPCAAVGVALAFGWPWWATVAAVAAGQAVYARFAGLSRAALSALVGTAGVVLMVERHGAGAVPVRVVDLGAMAALLAIALLLGRAEPPA